MNTLEEPELFYAKDITPGMFFDCVLGAHVTWKVLEKGDYIVKDGKRESPGWTDTKWYCCPVESEREVLLFCFDMVSHKSKYNFRDAP